MSSVLEPVEQTESRVIERFSDPVRFANIFWPQYNLYNKQKEIMYSVRDNYRTIVPAGNELGKDFIAALTTLWFFVSRRPARIVTTSPNSNQLEDVLWGEMRRFIEEAKYPLPIEVMMNMEIFQVRSNGSRVPRTELVGKVAQKGESMLGRHADRTPFNEPTTLLVVDEASGCADDSFEKADTWTHRILIIGNPYTCSNFFFKGVKMGDVVSEKADTGEEKLYNKVIQIRACDSPNVRLAEAEIATGKKPSHTKLVPGVITYADMIQRRKVWDKIRQSVGLDAEFYQGAEVLLYPPMWLDNAERIHRLVKLKKTKRRCKGIGIDPAEGGDYTSYSAVDQHGLIERVKEKTPNTAKVGSATLAFMRKHNLYNCSRVCFDRGGGGKQHADYLRQMIRDSAELSSEFIGDFRSVGFGESATPTSSEPKIGSNTHQDKKEDKEQKYAYKNKRAEMAGRLRLRLDPSIEDTQFAIPAEYTSLREELSPIPLKYDAEGRLKLPPKSKSNPNSKEETLIELIGHSPDEFDSVILAVYAMEVDAPEPQAGVIL